MITRRTRRVMSKPKPKPKAPAKKAYAPKRAHDPYKPKAPIKLPPGTKFKPIPPGVRKGPVGGPTKPTIKPGAPSTGGPGKFPGKYKYKPTATAKPKPKVKRKPRTRKATTRQRRA